MRLFLEVEVVGCVCWVRSEYMFKENILPGKIVVAIDGEEVVGVVVVRRV